jgi:PAS domain S-box-containing protein
VCRAENAGGDIAYWFGSATDIQEQKQAQEELRELIEQRELAFDAARIGLWDWDLVENRGRWSPEQRHLFGLPDNFEGDFDRFTEFVHPEDRERVLSFMKGVLADAGRVRYDEEFRIVQPGGEIRWLHGRGRIYRTNPPGGRVRIIGVNMDVTDRKVTEIALSDALKRLSFHANNSPLALSSGTRTGGSPNGTNGRSRSSVTPPPKCSAFPARIGRTCTRTISPMSKRWAGA